MSEKLATLLTKKIGKLYPRSETDLIKIQYGLELMLENLFSLLLIFIVALISGFFKEAMFTYMAFAFLRLSAGGRHCETKMGCSFVTALVVLAGGWVSSMFNMPLFAGVIAFIVLEICLFIFAPRGTENNPIRPNLKKYMKIKSMIIALIYLLIFIFDKNRIVGTSFLMGTIAEVLSII